MLKNIAVWSWQILYKLVLRAKKPYHFQKSTYEFLNYV